LATSEELLSNALDLAESIAEPKLVAHVLYCQSEVMRNRHRYTEALSLLSRAADVAADSPVDRSFLGSIKAQTGNIHLELNQYREAEAAMREGLEAVAVAEDNHATAQLTGQLGLVFLRAGQLDAAEDQYTAAKRNYAQVGQATGVAACAYNLSEIAKRRGDHGAAWSYQVESLEAEVGTENWGGMLTSLEQLASLVNTEDQLSEVLARINSINDQLPFLTLETHPGVMDSLRARAHISAGLFERARELLLQTLADRYQNEDIGGQAVCLGRLSEVALLEGNFTEALQHNEQSRQAYEAAGHPDGIATCCQNGISIAVHLNDLDSAIQYACAGIRLSALRGDLVRTVQMCHLLAARVIPMLPEPPQILYPIGDFTFAYYMGIIAGAADACDLGRLVGSIQQLLLHFGPGGISIQDDE
jgi:tetratricopeptide (TPR) repeat protein